MTTCPLCPKPLIFAEEPFGEPEYALIDGERKPVHWKCLYDRLGVVLKPSPQPARPNPPLHR